MGYETPFAGLKCVDVSQGVAGPYCAMLLAQYGANVIKVEPTEGGDWSRGLGVRYGDNTAYSIAPNLGKRSIALDLKQAAGRAALWRLGGLERSGDGLRQLAHDEHPLVRLIAQAALLREESRGAHLRTDFPDRDPSLDGRHVTLRAEAGEALEAWA